MDALQFYLLYLLLGAQCYLFVGIVLVAVSDTWLQWKTGRCRHYGEPLSAVPRLTLEALWLALTWPVDTKEKFFG